jgi:release factor glutamine methyltransferase
MTSADDALVKLGQLLLERGYRFTTITPESHRRVNARPKTSSTLRDIFGWSRSFHPEALPRE